MSKVLKLSGQMRVIPIDPPVSAETAELQQAKFDLREALVDMVRHFPANTTAQMDARENAKRVLEQTR